MDTKGLVFDGVGKSFPGVRALHNVTFGTKAGSVHALMGENGAGKSTLLKILSGLYRADTGKLRVDGQPVQFKSTGDAIDAGVAVIYQELHLVPNVSVAENLYLGNLPQRLGFVDRRKLQADSLRLLQMLKEDIAPRRKLSSLSLGQRQMVEIAKALARNARVIAFDEPTSSLSARETDRLFDVIKDLQKAGKTILYVSHRMDEIYKVCDAATVLRDGQHVHTFDSLDGVPRDELVRRMVGRSIGDVFGYTERDKGDLALEVTNLTGPGVTRPASFSVKRGQILGFFGLVGAGRSELMRLVYGAERATGGEVKIDGRVLQISNPGDAIRGGLVLSPEDRKKDGIFPVAGVMENLNISARRRFSPLKFFINEKLERANAKDYVTKLAVKTPSLRQAIGKLSGGNQQKVILARWLSENPKVVLLDEPTRGIDVGAKSEIYSIIYGLARSGVAVVVVSSELPEVMGVCDAVAVMRQGQIVDVVDRKNATEESLLAMALPISE